MARRLSNKTSPKSRGKIFEQMELDGKITDARMAEVEHLDTWKRNREAAARARWVEIRDSRRVCQAGAEGGKACTLTAVIWVVTWSTAPTNSVWCKKHWPQGEGKAIESPLGWLPDARAVADLGWNLDHRWGPAIPQPRFMHIRHGIGYEFHSPTAGPGPDSELGPGTDQAGPNR